MTTLRPKRERLVDALACVASHSYSDAPTAAASAVAVYHDEDSAHVIEYMLGELSITPKDAWELLATREIIPMGWLDDPRRRFADPVVDDLRILSNEDAFMDGVTFVVEARHASGARTSENWNYRRDEAREFRANPNAYVEAMLARLGERVKAAAVRRLIPHPATLAACVAFAADVPNVLAAEQIAREITRHDRVVWCVEPAAVIAPTRVSTARGVVGELAPPGHLTCPDLAALGYTLQLAPGDVATLVCPALGDSG